MRIHPTRRLPVGPVLTTIAWLLVLIGFVLLTMRLPAGTAPDHAQQSVTGQRS